MAKRTQFSFEEKIKVKRRGVHAKSGLLKIKEVKIIINHIIDKEDNEKFNISIVILF